MSDFIYDERGVAQAFRLGDYLYDMKGHAIGRVSAERVYHFDGTYVGELFKNMVVEKPGGARRDLPSVGRPRDVEPPALDAGRGGGNQGFPDVLSRLLNDVPSREPG